MPSYQEVATYTSDGFPQPIIVDPRCDDIPDSPDSPIIDGESFVIRKSRRTHGSSFRRNDAVQRSWMFRQDAEDHYFGSIIVTPTRGSVLGILPKQRKDVSTTFVDNCCEDLRMTVKPVNPYADSRLTNTRSNRRSLSLVNKGAD